MAPNAWTAFVFFGIPLTLGLLGVFHSGRRLAGRYRWSPDVGTDVRPETRAVPTTRWELVKSGVLFAGSMLLVAHSGRWLLQIYGLL